MGRHLAVIALLVSLAPGTHGALNDVAGGAWRRPGASIADAVEAEAAVYELSTFARYSREGINSSLYSIAAHFTDAKRLYAADRKAHVIWQIDAASGVRQVLAGQLHQPGHKDSDPTHSSAPALFSSPRAVCCAGNGDLFVLDANGRTVRRIDEHGEP